MGVTDFDPHHHEKASPTTSSESRPWERGGGEKEKGKGRGIFICPCSRSLNDGDGRRNKRGASMAFYLYPTRVHPHTCFTCTNHIIYLHRVHNNLHQIKALIAMKILSTIKSKIFH